jgi:hypothetical protein
MLNVTSYPPCRPSSVSSVVEISALICETH